MACENDKCQCCIRERSSEPPNIEEECAYCVRLDNVCWHYVFCPQCDKLKKWSRRTQACCTKFEDPLRECGSMNAANKNEEILSVRDGKLKLGDNVIRCDEDGNEHYHCVCVRNPFEENDDWQWMIVDHSEERISYRPIFGSDRYKIFSSIRRE